MTPAPPATDAEAEPSPVADAIVDRDDQAPEGVDPRRRRSTLGIVIVSFNTRDLLAACLDSLRAEIEGAGLAATVHVVDNASDDGSAGMVAERFPWINLTVLPTNRGFTAGNNVLLAPWARGDAGSPDWALLLNPDTEVRPGALRTLLAAAEADPRIAVAGPALVYPDGGFQHAAFAFPGILQAALDLFPPRGRLGARLLESRLNGRYDRRLYRAGRPFAVDFVLGACLLVRTAAIRSVGPLDEGYFMYAEEVDWCRRFARTGWRRVCVPAAVVLHHGGAASSQFRARSWSTLWRSRRRYLRRQEPAWRAAAVDLLLRWAVAGLRRADARAGLSQDERALREAAYAAALAPLDSDPGGGP